MVKAELKFATHYNDKKQLCTSVEVSYIVWETGVPVEKGVTGLAVLSKEDKNHRALGQKYAILDAVKKVSDREVRKEIWKIFHDHSRGVQKIVTYKDKRIDVVSPCIKVWSFYEAPKEYQQLSTNGGDEDWLAFVPEAYMNQHIPWLDGTLFGCCSVDAYDVEGGIIKIGSHA